MLARCGGRKVEDEDLFLEKVYKIWEKKDWRFVSFSLTACDESEDDELSDLFV